MHELAIALISVVVGALGGLLGIGGGVFMIPILTLGFGVPIKDAIGASLISVIATSSAAGAGYVGHGLANVRLAMVLEIATTAGAIAGGLTAVAVAPKWLEGAFAAIMVLTAYGMGFVGTGVRPASTGLLEATYEDALTGHTVRYGVRRLPFGLGASFLAGGISGLLGIGGGVVKVPIMTLLMGVPLRAGAATSNFMIGVTAGTSAVIWLQRGYISASLAVPTALGVLVGASLEPWISRYVRGAALKRVFQVVLFIVAVQMAWKATHP